MANNIDKITLRGVNYPIIDSSVPAYVRGITQADITNWNSKTDNVGTITGITMNGTSKGTSGVVNLGTVITSETRLSKGTTTGNGNAVTDISVSNHQITLTKGKTFLESFTETDPIYSASAAAGITSTDITNWNSKTSNVGTITGINMNGASKGTSGVVDLGTVLTSHQSLSSYANAIEYNSSEKKIYLKHDNTTLGNPINATDFIKDGMVETAYVQGGNLVISFNTDAGKSPVSIPVTDIFNASNYYTKTEINNAAYLQSETDPVYSASAAAGITSSDITNWNSKTSNTGTITGINMNGASKGTSGVVDLGTVITSETQLSKGTTTGSGNAVTDISVSNHQITLTKGSTFLTSETDPIYSASAAAGITSGMITNWNSYANVQSDWNETDSTSNSYILNKPTIPNGLPTVSSTDNGKVLQVVNGVWSLVSPVTMYSGTGTPNNTQGNNGDLYMQI